MCGIFGWSWLPNKMPRHSQRVALAVLLGHMNDKRGGHSWGWHELGGEIQRGLGDIAPHVAKAVKFRSMFAHTRWATHGGQTVSNAHPFEIGNLVGAHNGVIWNHSELNTKFQRNFDVDSQHIFAHLDEDKPMSDLNGYGAIEWIDLRRPGRIFLSRMTGDGQLGVVATEYGIIWSSDTQHLKTAIESVDLKIEADYKIEASQVYYAHEGVLYVDTDRKVAISNERTVSAKSWDDYKTPSTYSYLGSSKGKGKGKTKSFSDASDGDTADLFDFPGQTEDEVEALLKQHEEDELKLDEEWESDYLKFLTGELTDDELEEKWGSSYILGWDNHKEIRGEK